MVKYETVRFEITEHFTRDGVAGSDSIVLYPPIDKFVQEKDVRRIVNESELLEPVITGYTCIQLAGFFKYPENMTRPPTQEEVNTCKKLWGESPYKHACYGAPNYSLCKNIKNPGIVPNDENLDHVNCVDCLRMLAKQKLF